MSAMSSTQHKPHPLENYVRTQLQSGNDEETIISELGKSGVEENAARRLVDSMKFTSANAPMPNTGASGSIQMALLGGLFAALVAGFIWGGIIIVTGYEIGIVAWFVGGACGYSVLLFSKGETSSTHSFIAVASSIFGILVGKYFAFYVELKAIIEAEVGPGTAANMSVFSLGLFGEYMANLGEMLGMYDMLWIGLAIVSAWKLTSNGE